ncbi:MAG TPA: transcriptional repressor, partial [Kofleriaceae bacterium]|nr:transcriptional repressor [Kofleriaceae bacterium]
QALRPLSHAETVAQLAARTGDDVTVFRALTDLTRVRLVRRIDVGDRMWRFEADRHDMVSHPHFVCIACASVTCLFDVDVALPTRNMPRSIRKHEVQVLLRGRCDDCEAS